MFLRTAFLKKCLYFCTISGYYYGTNSSYFTLEIYDSLN